MRLPALTAILLVAGRTTTAQTIRPEPPAIAPIAAGIGLGAVGFLGGALIGAGMSRDCAREFCGLGETAIGAVLGETIGLAAGVHLGDRRRGNLGYDLLASAAVATAGIVVASGNDRDAGGALLVTATAQLVTVVMLERRVGRAREGRLRVSITPMPRRRVAIRASVALPQV